MVVKGFDRKKRNMGKGRMQDADSNITGNESKTTLGTGILEKKENKKNKRQKNSRNTKFGRVREGMTNPVSPPPPPTALSPDIEQQETIKMISAGVATGIFLVITVVYFVIKFFFIDNGGGKKRGLAIVLKLIYFLSVISSQIGINLYNTKAHCGEQKPGLAISYTIISNLLVLGVLFVVMIFYPGWKAPFSNTLGYIFVRNSARPLIDAILGDKPKTESPELNKILNEIRHETGNNKRDFLINQLTPSTFDKVIERFVSNSAKNKLPVVNATVANISTTVPPLSLGGGRRSKKKYKQNGGALEMEKKKLKKLITIKDSIAEALWYILGGVMVSNYSNAYISSIDC